MTPYELKTMLAILDARASGFVNFAAALETELRAELSKTQADPAQPPSTLPAGPMARPVCTNPDSGFFGVVPHPLKAAFSFTWKGKLFQYSKGQYWVDGRPTGKNTFQEVRKGRPIGRPRKSPNKNEKCT